MNDPASATAPAATTDPDDEILVRVRGLTKRYGDFSAVGGINLDVPVGQVFGVLGPNGAGKTTTMRMITGLIEPSDGSITIDGFDLQTDTVNAKKVTGFIPDRPYVYDKLTAFEYLSFIGGLYSMSHSHLADRIDELLTLFELREWSDGLIESFSHGMKQRLVFAGAMLPEPRLLVIDEPMVGLDPKGHHLIKRLFRSLVEEERMSILLSTHTLEVAEEVCDQIVIINHGQIIARGTLDELQLESGATGGTLEQVFLTLTEESEHERDQAVAARFGKDTSDHDEASR